MPYDVHQPSYNLEHNKDRVMPEERQTEVISELTMHAHATFCWKREVDSLHLCQHVTYHKPSTGEFVREEWVPIPEIDDEDNPVDYPVFPDTRTLT